MDKLDLILQKLDSIDVRMALLVERQSHRQRVSEEKPDPLFTDLNGLRGEWSLIRQTMLYHESRIRACEAGLSAIRLRVDVIEGKLSSEATAV